MERLDGIFDGKRGKQKAKEYHITPKGKIAERLHHLTQGSGLSAEQIAVCDHFVYIPQYG